MTTIHKLLPAVLVLLACWNGPALAAEQASPTYVNQSATTVEQAENTDFRSVDDRLAWQRVGSPLSLEA